MRRKAETVAQVTGVLVGMGAVLVLSCALVTLCYLVSVAWIAAGPGG